ncbi:MAG: hypothetical protein ABSD56_08450 [Bryobacteraceae bacterium]
MPECSAKDDSWLALRGAFYHLWQVTHQFKKGLASNDKVELFHWHLRSFFWEMVAVRDSLKRAARTDRRIEEALHNLDDQQWFQEVSAYRNFAHESFHVVEAAVSARTGRAVVFQLQCAIQSQTYMADGLALLRDYWKKMERFLKALFP